MLNMCFLKLMESFYHIWKVYQKIIPYNSTNFTEASEEKKILNHKFLICLIKKLFKVLRKLKNNFRFSTEAARAIQAATFFMH